MHGDLPVVEKKAVSGGKTTGDWLRDCNFYLHGLVYTMARVAMVTTISIQPFYLTLVTGFETSIEKPTPIQLALVPLCSFLSSLVFSIFF